MNDHQANLAQSGRQFDPGEQVSGQVQELVSNLLAGRQDVLLREIHFACHHTHLRTPAFMDDTLLVLTKGYCDLQGRIIRPFHHYATLQYCSLIPRGVPTEFQMTGSYDLVTLLPNPAFMARIACEALDIDSTRLELRVESGFYDPLIYAIGLALRDDIAAGGCGSRLYTDSLNHTLAIHLLRHYSTSVVAPSQPPLSLSSSQLHRVLAYMNDEFNRNLDLTELAAVAGYSPTYFTHQFKQATGLSPHQYLIRCRVERAKELLVRGGLTIAEVAHQVGFADHSHLNRHFKHLLGVSPRIFLSDSKNVQDLSKNVQD